MPPFQAISKLLALGQSAHCLLCAFAVSEGQQSYEEVLQK